MNEFEIVAEPRTLQGKGASRRLRRDGKVPAVVYGGSKAPESIQVQHHELLHHSENEAFYSHILTLKTDSGSERVVLKDMQRHPYKTEILHMDLLRVAEDEKLTMRVPLHFINEDKAVGVKQGGGIVNHVINELEIVCLPKDLPEYIEVDVIDLNVDEALHLGDLKLPEGVESSALAHGGDPSQPVVAVSVPRGMAADEEDEAAAASDEATGEGESESSDDD